ncbi:MAG: PAS domain-containing protein [Actinomycetota bacterium]|nr:PAS domain-containing protein [Actinomycetota bacterium]
MGKDIKQLENEISRLRQALDDATLELNKCRGGLPGGSAQMNFFYALSDAVPAPLFMKDMAGVYLNCNTAFGDFMGVPPAVIHGKTAYDIAPKELADFYTEADRSLFRNGGVQLYGTSFRRANGEIRDIIVRKAVFQKEDGSIEGLVGSVSDVTEIRQAEEQINLALKEKETLLRELNHRTKNNMQVISSLIDLQTASVADGRVRGMLKDTRDRIRAMSLVHEFLYKSRDLARLDIRDYIEVLANAMVLSYQEQAQKVILDLDIDSIQMSIDTITPCGLILNELISNSLKYAFPGGKAGSIRISLHRREGGQIGFDYSDDGIGLPPTVEIKGVETLGLRLVNNLATKQLGGRIDVETGQGTVFRMIFKGE